MRDLIENAPARQLGRAPGAPDKILMRQPRYFGICTRSLELARRQQLAEKLDGVGHEIVQAQDPVGSQHGASPSLTSTLVCDLDPSLRRAARPDVARQIRSKRSVQTAASGLNVKATPLMQ
jgi:hypothetical protein